MVSLGSSGWHMGTSDARGGACTRAKALFESALDLPDGDRSASEQ